jgi:hypothetical protein
MTDTALQGDVTASATTVNDISDEKLNEFFEKGGDVDFAQDETKELQQSKDNVDASQSQNKNNDADNLAKQDGEKDIERNYKAAMHEERERRKEIQRELENQKKLAEDAIQRTQKLEQTWQQLMQHANQQQSPNFEEDPIAALKYQYDNLKQSTQQLHQHVAQKDYQEQQYNQVHQFKIACNKAVGDYIKQTPDYLDAYNFAKESRIKEFEALGYKPQDIPQLIEEDEAVIAVQAFRDGVNPAERIYQFAKIRGYQGKQADAQTTAKQNEQRLEKLEKGMQASKSLSNTNGQTATAELTLDAISKMSQDELDEFMANEKNWDKLGKLMK